MKFIESNELRDWVKENLRKTIFQNAHALAVQTGCEVLVKLQDNMDISGRQYYATHKLQKAYMNNGLRKHPAEMLVSGETGLPAVNQATQIGDDAKGTEPDVPTDNGVETEEPVVMTTSSNQTDDNDGEPSGEVQIKMEAMSGDEDSNDTNQDSLRDNESGMDIDMFANISPLSRNHGNSQQRFTSPLTSQSPQHLYQCAICQKTFRTINILQMHTQTFHMTHQRGAASMISPNRMLNIRGKARSGRKSYAKQEQEQRRYPCPMCERTFHHPDLLKDHVSRSHMGQSILASSLKGIPVSSTVTTDTSSSPSPSSSQSQGPVTSSVPGSSPSQGFQDTAGPSSAAEEDLDQQIQMSPVKQLIKTITFLGNLGNHPSSLFSQSTPSPFKHPGGGMSNRNSSPAANQILKIMKKPRFRLQPSQPSPKPTTPMSIQDIKRSILLTAGPVATYRTFAKQGSPHLRSITKEQYSQAVHELEAHDLGTVITCKRGSRPESIIYIKKPPQDVEEGLKTHDLVAMDKYTEKYQRPPPSGMNANVRLKVVELGYVTEEQMRSQPCQGRLFVPHGQADVLPV